MKRKICTLIMVFILLVVNNNCIFAYNEDEFEKFETFDELFLFIDEHLNDISNAYYDEFGKEWDIEYIEYCKEILNSNDEVNYYLFKFNKGFLLLNLNMELVDFDPIGFPLIYEDVDTYFFSGSYYYKENDQYQPNSINAYNGELDYTSIFSSQICFPLDSMPGNYEIVRSYSIDIATNKGYYGKYDVITGEQGETSDCGAQAALNYVATLQKSDSAYFVHSSNWQTEITEMRTLMNYPKSGVFEGIFPWEFKQGVYSYCNEPIIIAPTNLDLCIGLYSNINAVKTAHYALFVGQARKKIWWFFYNYYDIISTWNQNFEDEEDMFNKKYDIHDNYYYVNHYYALAYYRMADGTYEKKN